MATFPPAPTYAELGLKDPVSGEVYINPVWLAWFLAVVQLITASGGGGGTFIHNDLSSLQGGNTTERFHLNAADYSVLTSNPGSDKIIFYDTSAAGLAQLIVCSGLSISGTTLTATGGSGTVTSVAQTVPSILSVSGSPVTSSGTLAISLATQSANLVFAGPASGGAATPTFRTLVADDVPGGGSFTAASQAQQEAGTSNSVAVTPGVQQFHPSAAKTWAYVTVSAGTPTISASYNVTSITDTGVGRLTVTIATDFSSANWAHSASVDYVFTAVGASIRSENKAAGSIQLDFDVNNAAVDPDAWNFIAFGDQA